MAKNWIAGAIKKPGALRKSMGVKEGQSMVLLQLLRKTHLSLLSGTITKISIKKTLNPI